MKILILTNLYPPQELGGYGRSMSDFAWGLISRGHQVEVLTGDAPYLGNGGCGPSGEPVWRKLKLFGDYKHGINILKDEAALRAVSRENCNIAKVMLNSQCWDGALVGNLDLIGIDVLNILLSFDFRVLHHIGFTSPPFPSELAPRCSHYQIVPASLSVRNALVQSGFSVSEAPVVYPGARTELFGFAPTGRPLPDLPSQALGRPLKIGCASLLMRSKGIHTILEAAVRLRCKGIYVDLMIAGGSFDDSYRKQLIEFSAEQGIGENVQFVGQLDRLQLSRFMRLQHAFVFPSIMPEAFGIVAAEAMASGLALLSTGVGGANELFQDGSSGLRFTPGDSESLAEKLMLLIDNPNLLSSIASQGEREVRERFDLCLMAEQLEALFEPELNSKIPIDQVVF